MKCTKPNENCTIASLTPFFHDIKTIIRHCWVTLILAPMISSCFVGTVRHQPQSAIRVAEEFTRASFVDRDFERALGYASKEKMTLRAGAFEQAILQIQGSVPFPADVQATAYEIPFGQNQVIVFLEGSGESRMSYYRVLTVGNANSEYLVMEVFRADSPFPKGPLQEPVQ